MAAGQIIYRMWCTDEADFVYTDFVSSVPTECPNNAGHSIVEASISAVQEDTSLDFGTGAGQISEGDHNHDAAYSASGHDHDATYSALAHNHDATYSALAHNHDATYSALAHDHNSDYHVKTDFVLTATAGKLPKLDGSGLLAFAQMPVGSGSSQVAQGDHNHDHGALTGKDDDDHTLYSLADGTRAFSGVVSGVTPTADAHLATMGYVDSAVQGVIWKLPVIDRDLTAPPGGETLGDRYLVAAGGSGDWSGKDGQIAQFTDPGWDFTVPSEGMVTSVLDENLQIRYGDSAWQSFGETVDHGNLAGLSDDDHSIYHTDARGDARYPLLTDHVLTATADKFPQLNGSGLLAFAQMPVGTGSSQVAQGDHGHTDDHYTKTNMQTSGQAQVHWDNLTNKPGGITARLHIDCSDGSNPYLGKNVANYAVVHRFIFPGTTDFNLATIKAIVWAGTSGKTVGLRIYDLTNAKVIVEKSDITVNEPTLMDLGTLADKPAGAAMFETQIKYFDGPSACNVSAILLSE